ncbi:MAG: GNAT family N-acetyltransferase [Pyrinomonadaceae bacterium]
MNAAAESQIQIREIETVSEMRTVEFLQKVIWGIPDLDVVPVYHLAATRASGGVLLGAFDKDAMVGFVYGFVGYERGITLHHSHMLAVQPEYRSHDIGARLKLEQRERVLKQGIKVMTWTFDPLQSLNAYFNFAKLGVIADQYYVDFYGSEAASFLHRNGTDRLWVSWHLDTDRVTKKLEAAGSSQEMADLPSLVKAKETGEPFVADHKIGASSEKAVIEIPADINAVEREDIHLARAWRIATRKAFTDALNAGLIVEDFYRRGEPTRAIGVYVLGRDPGPLNWKVKEERAK